MCYVKKTRYNEAGFTLMEVMFASVAVVIALVGLLGSFAACMQLVERARNQAVATSDASCVMEAIRNSPFADITTTNWTTWALTNGLTGLGSESVTVTYPNGAGANPQLVNVSLSWVEMGRARSTQLVTQVTSR